MLDASFAKAKVADLDAELDLYRKIDGIEVAKAEDLTNKDLRVTEIERLQKAEGIPVELTPEFLKENPTLAKVLIDGGAAEGDIVLAEEADIAKADELSAEASTRAGIYEEIAQLTGKDATEVESELATLTTDELNEKLTEAKGSENSSETAPAASDSDENADLVFQYHHADGGAAGHPQTVVRVDNVLLHGKQYKEVHLANGESNRMTTEEFTRDVKPRA